MLRPGKQISAADCTETHTDTSQQDVAGLSRSSHDENACSVCSIQFEGYEGAGWLQCVFCLKWVCGNCNGAEYDPTYGCPNCS